MSIEQALIERSGNRCELCSSEIGLSVYQVPPVTEESADRALLICEKCHSEVESDAALDVNHWRCLNDSMWSQVPAVQVMAWRLLTRLIGQAEIWANDQRDLLYMDPELQSWAEAGVTGGDSDSGAPTLDSNGTVLEDGDTVTLIKDLPVKGAGFTAKRGTAVRNISLTNNPEQIEGRVNGVRIVLLTQYLKKAN
ncbi:Alkylphosphonate utilization operon protein PhnA [Marinobacterium lacunae]|uniref:Alkylphosphonate utilization operon protein PhnA n=1 Tax=Marinobacterium lacunae TaxID=1232683 RepID=A0A081FVS1_9GAMM|nr:alkylphosphonate utilization protein [Marinobacterium lacunae]KEA62626.1 Alkylphosphonate utilization operon protein PhnA [Marinobacterium lacunae]MBR9884938.1 PhnA domain protein [Oceanospirillales bacterium]